MPQRPIDNIDSTIQVIQHEALIAIVSGETHSAKLLEVSDALLASPVVVMEVTLGTCSALDNIDLLRARHGENMLIGAGDVRTRLQWDAAIRAGAQFTVSPFLDLNTVERAKERGILHIPGLATHADADAAKCAGCKIVQLVQPSFKRLRSIRTSVEDVLFVASGNITRETIGDYRRAGAAAVGIGSSLVTSPAQPMADLITRARKLRAAWKQAVPQ